jgi:hypothetical protein
MAKKKVQEVASIWERRVSVWIITGLELIDVGHEKRITILETRYYTRHPKEVSN